MSGFGSIHALKNPVDYRVTLMGTCVINNRVQGVSVHILRRNDDLLAIDPSDDANLKRFMAVEGTQLVGWGVLVEKAWVDEWFVAWRPFTQPPEPIEWNDK